MRKVVTPLALVLLMVGCAFMNPQLRRQNYINAHPDMDNYTRERITEGMVFIGMSREELVASWGRPTTINKSVGSWGVHEQFVYRGYRKATYVYVEDGYVTSWQK